MANFLNNQGVRTPLERGLGRSVHTFRRGFLVKFRKSPHWTEKALRHAQKPATPRSTNPSGPESTYVVPGKDPPMGPREIPPLFSPPAEPNDVGKSNPSERPFRSLLRLAKVTQKRGFCRGFCRRFSGNTLPLDQPPAGSGPPFEKRESGNYSETLINAILSRAQGKTLAIPAATAALEMCAGVVGRSRR